MRICFVSIEYPPSVTGGAGVYAKCLCQELAKLGHDVHVITPRLDPKKSQYVQEGVFVHRIPVINKTALWIPSFWINARSYYRALRKRLAGFDILHGNVNSDLSLTDGLVRAPRVVTIHHLGRTAFDILNLSFFDLLRNPSGEVGLGSWLEKNTMDFDKVVAARADQVIAVSQFCKRDLISKYGISPSKISVIPNGVYAQNYVVSEEEIDATRKRLNGSDEFLVLFVGRLERRKGLPLLLKAFRSVSRKTRSKLVIVGSGKQDESRQLASSLGIGSRVVFVGYIDDSNLRRIYCACDLFVSSSRLEGFGITLLEAMAAGKPVIALNVGGISEIIKDGVHGRLLSNMNHKEIAKAILYFARNRELARSVGQRNRRYVIERFSWTRNAKLTEHLYENLL